MEGDTEFGRHLARLDQNVCGLLTAGAELPLERDAAVDRRNGDAHEQREVTRRPLGTGRLGDDLLQFILGIEREAANAMLVVSAANSFAGLHGVHEVQLRARNGRGVLDLGNGGDVEMANAGAVERSNQKDRAVRLVGVSHIAIEIFDEPVRSASGGVRPGTHHGTLRLAGCNELCR